MKFLLRESYPFMGIFEFTKDWTERDWQNPLMIFLLPIMALVALMDIATLPFTFSIWIFRTAIIKTASFLSGKDEGDFYLKKRKTYSPFSSHEVRAMFIQRHLDMGYNERFDVDLSGCYQNQTLQTKWEEFANGFRLGEDSKL